MNCVFYIGAKGTVFQYSNVWSKKYTYMAVMPLGHAAAAGIRSQMIAYAVINGNITKLVKQIHGIEEQTIVVDPGADKCRFSIASQPEFKREDREHRPNIRQRIRTAFLNYPLVHLYSEKMGIYFQPTIDDEILRPLGSEENVHETTTIIDPVLRIAKLGGGGERRTKMAPGKVGCVAIHRGKEFRTCRTGSWLEPRDSRFIFSRHRLYQRSWANICPSTKNRCDRKGKSFIQPN